MRAGRLGLFTGPQEPAGSAYAAPDGRHTVSIHKRSTNRGTRYDVRLRDHGGKVHNKTFRTRREAEAFERDQLRHVRRSTRGRGSGSA